MPCPPSWEERMVMHGEYEARRLQNDYPILKQRYDQLIEIFNYFEIELPQRLIFETQMPVCPAIPTDWPTMEEGESMQKFADQVVALFSKLERWLCEVSTQLILAMDQPIKPFDAEIGERIQKQIDLHKIHREEDRTESANQLRQQITWYDLALKLEKYNSEIQKEEFLAEKQLRAEKLERLLNFSIEELIRDRNLTNI